MTKVVDLFIRLVLALLRVVSICLNVINETDGATALKELSDVLSNGKGDIFRLSLLSMKAPKLLTRVVISLMRTMAKLGFSLIGILVCLWLFFWSRTRSNAIYEVNLEMMPKEPPFVNVKFRYYRYPYFEILNLVNGLWIGVMLSIEIGKRPARVIFGDVPITSIMVVRYLLGLSRESVIWVKFEKDKFVRVLEKSPEHSILGSICFWFQWHYYLMIKGIFGIVLSDIVLTSPYKRVVDAYSKLVIDRKGPPFATMRVPAISEDVHKAKCSTPSAKLLILTKNENANVHLLQGKTNLEVMTSVVDLIDTAHPPPDYLVIDHCLEEVPWYVYRWAAIQKNMTIWSLEDNPSLTLDFRIELSPFYSTEEHEEYNREMAKCSGPQSKRGYLEVAEGTSLDEVLKIVAGEFDSEAARVARANLRRIALTKVTLSLPDLI